MLFSTAPDEISELSIHPHRFKFIAFLGEEFMKLKKCLLSWAVLLAATSAGVVRAETVTWTIDSDESWIRMTIPDQFIDIGGGVQIFAGLRGAQPIFDVTPGANNPAVVPWSDSRGARAPLGGTLTTEYEEGSSIQFSQANNSASFLETGKWIPNRNKWNTALDPDNFDFHKPQDPDPNGGFPAVFATELTLAGVVRVGHVTLYNIGLHVDGTASMSGTGPWTQSGGPLTIGGAAGGILDFWAQTLTTSARVVGNPNATAIEDRGSSLGINTGNVTIEDMGGNVRKMTIPLDIDFTLFISDLPLVDSVYTGQIVAYATLAPQAEVVNRFVSHTGFSGSGTPPDNAIDTVKVLAKEGSGPTALSEANLINTSRGVNGVVFDIQNLGDGGALSAADFEVQVSPQGAFDAGANPPAGWAAGPAPSSVTVVAGSPDRVRIEWPNGSITNRWLRITVKANANTGLASPESYYVGHLLGETTGLAGSVYTVAFADITPIRSAAGSTVDASSIADIDKNGTVSFADISAMRSNVGAQLTNITIP